MRALTLALALLGTLLLAAPAAAHHAGTVTTPVASLALDPPRCKASEPRPSSRCQGLRTARVSWSAGCGARPFVTVALYAARAGGGAPIALATEDGGEATSGVTTTLLGPGAHVYATVTMDCSWDDADGTGPEAHTLTSTSAPTTQVVVPPWLRQVRAIKANYCNFNPGFDKVLLQAGQRGSILDFSIDYMDSSLLGVSRRRPAGVRQVWVRARGAGVRLRRHPEMSLLGEFGRRDPVAGALRVNPRRPGRLRVWAEVGGTRTNTLAVRVVRNRC